MIADGKSRQARWRSASDPSRLAYSFAQVTQYGLHFSIDLNNKLKREPLTDGSFHDCLAGRSLSGRKPHFQCE
jgi:hypothetical protein